MRILPVLLSLLITCAPHMAHAAKLKVVASFSILGDMTRHIGGDHIALTTLVGPDSNVHGYSPSPSDASKLADADLVIINGMGLEGWMERLITSSGYSGIIVTASHGITPLTSDDDEDEPDFHAWQDAQNGIIYYRNISNALIKADPAQADIYRQKARQAIAELSSTDAWITSQVSSIPKDKRKLITTHNAFGYFAKAYDVTFIAPRGISTQSDPSAGDMARLIDQLRNQHIRAVFLENISDDRMIKQLQHDNDAYIGGTLYSDALSSQHGPAPTYIKLLRHNTRQLVHGMQHNN
jgi:zinc/manganese transport system substrate-binding protein